MLIHFSHLNQNYFTEILATPLKLIDFVYYCQILIHQKYTRKYKYTRLSTSHLRVLTKLSKILLLFLSNLCLCCGRTNLGPKYSYFSFSDWNLDGLTAHDSIKTRYFKRTFLQIWYVCQKHFLIILFKVMIIRSSEMDII